MKIQNATIAAIATGTARTPLGIIRLSGPMTFEIMSKIFEFKNKSRNITNAFTGSLSLGSIHGDSGIIDEAILSIFKSPDSYTGEDMAELSCHGNPLILRKVMETLVKNGALPAGPGDFTRRAYLNGKMDLTKAEAVSDIIDARTDASLKLSISQLFGAEKKVIEGLREGIIGLLALLEADVDFEHDEDPSNQADVVPGFESIIILIEKLIKSADLGLLIKEGAMVAITGRPNAGKSSLLNAITGFNRAIVTDIPGTTRDTIEESVVMDGIPVLLTDTAGIRHSSNPIEIEGIKRAKAAVKSSDAVIFTVDLSSPFTEEDKSLYAELSGKPHVIALNKTDMKHSFEAASLAGAFHPGAPVIYISALKNDNISSLTKAVKDIIMSSRGLDDPAEPVISALRHKTALETALREIREGLLSVNHSLSYEIAAEHAKAAAAAVSSITGEIAVEDVLEKIFSNFCIGK
jgi:tRNA modification GTPase